MFAWVSSVDVPHMAQAFMAPWAALPTVQATVFGTARGGVQQAGASVLGVLIAYAAWHVMGLSFASLTVAVLAGLLAGSVRGVRAQTTTAATPVVLLTTGYPNNGEILSPVYGALLVNLRTIMDALDAVAEAQPVPVPSSPLAPRQPVA